MVTREVGGTCRGKADPRRERVEKAAAASPGRVGTAADRIDRGYIVARPEIFNPETFHFRGLHPLVSIGTASDRYAGWLGQIYTSERYTGQITRRSHAVGGKAFVEEVLPVESVE